jgi:acyl-CoA reductase-like NAD-dependent aldehyde dehydrogenase
MGDGFKEGVEFGPLNNIMQFNKVKGIVEDAKKDGQPTPGSSGYFYEPTIIADVSRAFPSWNLGPY